MGGGGGGGGSTTCVFDFPFPQVIKLCSACVRLWTICRLVDVFVFKMLDGYKKYEINFVDGDVVVGCLSNVWIGKDSCHILQFL